METYEIKQIALMFNVARCTVLDWIVTGKLKADVRLQGLKRRYTIHKIDLKEFCRIRNVQPIRTPTGWNDTVQERGE